MYILRTTTILLLLYYTAASRCALHQWKYKYKYKYKYMVFCFSFGIRMMKKTCFLPLMSSVEQFCGLWIFFTWKEHIDFEDSRRIIIFWCTEWYLICASSTAFVKLHYWTTKSLCFMHVHRKLSSLILMNEKYSWIGFLWYGWSSSVNDKRPVSFLPGSASCLFVSFLRGAASCLFVSTTQS